MSQRRAKHWNPAGEHPDSLLMMGRNRYALGHPVLVQHDVSQLPDETLQARRPLYVIAVLLAISSLVVHQPLLFEAGLLIFALTAVPELWYRYCLRQFFVEREPTTGRAIFGDTVEVRLAMENRKVLPLPWVEIQDEFPDPLPVVGMRLGPSAKPERAVLENTFALWAYQRVRRRYRLRAVVRGVYHFGPMTVRASDPFGIMTREVTVEAPAALLVHPLVVPIERLGLPANSPFGEHKSAHRLLEDPLRTAGTRAYVPGDEPRRIHWKATARTGELQSKVYEPSTRHTLAIFLDVHTLAQQLMGYDPALVELAVCTAASVSNWALEQGYAVGIFSNGTLAALWSDTEHAGDAPEELRGTDAHAKDVGRLEREMARAEASLRLRLPAASRPEQLTRILDSLARLLPYYGLPMSQILAGEQHDLPLGATVVYIGAEVALDVQTIVTLRRLRTHGHAVSLLLTHPDGPERTDADRELHLADLPTHYIGGKALWEALVADALGPDPIGKASTGSTRETKPQAEVIETNGRDDGGTASATPSERARRALVVE